MFEETIHIHTYQYIMEPLGLDEKEIFDAYNEVPPIRNMDQFLTPFIEVINDPGFKTGALEADQKLLSRSSCCLSDLQAASLDGSSTDEVRDRILAS